MLSGLKVSRLRTVPVRRNQLRHGHLTGPDDQREEASEILDELADEVCRDEVLVPIGVDGDVLVVFVHLEHQTIVVGEGNRQILSVIQDRGSCLLVIADDPLRG